MEDRRSKMEDGGRPNAPSSILELHSSILEPRPGICPCLIFVGYAALLLFLVSWHEVWRDEVRAYSLARSAHDPVELIRITLTDEGHPPLWYLILWTGSRFYDDYLVLKVVAYLVALGFTGLAFFRAPFPLVHRCLFLFGILPLHIYSVICRHYGIAVLFLFLLAIEYSRNGRWSVWRAGVWNMLLAITNIYGTICATALVLLPLSFTQEPWKKRLGQWSIFAGWTAIGLLLAVYTVWPTSENLVMKRDFSPAVIGCHLFAAATDQSLFSVFHLTGYGWTEKIEEVLGKSGALALGLSCHLGILLALCRRPWFLLIYGGAHVAAALFSRLVYPASERQTGVLSALLLTLLWMARQRDMFPEGRYWRVMLWLLGGSLFLHAAWGCRTTLRDVDQPYSQSKNAGAFLAANYADAIVICEPDYFGDSLPYYTSNAIFLIREDRFRSYTTFADPFNRAVTLSEIMSTHDRLRKETGRTVILSFQEPIELLQPGRFPGAYGRELLVKRQEKQRFGERFAQIAAFSGVGRETFVFYKAKEDE